MARPRRVRKRTQSTRRLKSCGGTSRPPLRPSRACRQFLCLNIGGRRNIIARLESKGNAACFARYLRHRVYMVLGVAHRDENRIARKGPQSMRLQAETAPARATAAAADPVWLSSYP